MSLRLFPPAMLALAVGFLGTWLIFGNGKPADRRGRAVRLYAESLLSVGLLFFLFRYIFAANANMDYVQRFIASGGELNLAIDTSTERTIVALRFGPSLLSVFLLYLFFAARQHRYELLLTLLSVGLSTLSLPSAISTSGIGVLGWIGIVPLLFVLWRGNLKTILFYGVTYGVLTTVSVNYWLGTFSLVSLGAVTVIYLVYYTVFMLVFGTVILLFRDSSPALRVFLTAALWTMFEYVRSVGFLAYPWGLVAHSQYTNLWLIQISEITGVWGVTFNVVLFAAALSEFIGPLTQPVGLRPFVSAGPVLLGVTLLVFVVHGVGWWTVAADNRYPEPDSTPRVALIQQNSDPRKADYEKTFEVLTRLTDAALRKEPDIVVWSETAFVPNIRRWSDEDPKRYRLARLVDRFTQYQKSIDTWLLTGNDDYTRILDQSGREVERNSYNAAVLFSDTGERVASYHKMKLVPFTEYFPYEEQLPFIYNLLLDFDVFFWTPGERAVQFQHPKFSFSTPICFEDVFPNGVRRFVQGGADAIINITNDYWSLTKAQAQQHFAGSLFRAIENRRPFLRATASGVTAHVDPYGRVVARLPQYVEAQMMTEVDISSDAPRTIYTRFGDWFPRSLFVIVLLASLWRIPQNVSRLRRRT